MDYKACIFDLDGTLTDTLESLTFSVNETMKEIGLPGITQDQCRQFVGNGARVLIEKTLRAGGDEKLSLFDKAFSAYGRIFDENCTYRVEPYEPALEEPLECKCGFPPVVVCIPYHEPRKDEEEIHGHVAMVEMLVDGACGESFENMVVYHQEGSHSPEAVQEVIMGFCIRECRGRDVLHHRFNLCNLLETRQRY